MMCSSGHQHPAGERRARDAARGRRPSLGRRSSAVSVSVGRGLRGEARAALAACSSSQATSTRPDRAPPRCRRSARRRAAAVPAGDEPGLERAGGGVEAGVEDRRVGLARAGADVGRRPRQSTIAKVGDADSSRATAAPDDSGAAPPRRRTRVRRRRGHSVASLRRRYPLPRRPVARAASSAADRAARRPRRRHGMRRSSSAWSVSRGAEGGESGDAERGGVRASG